jgi:hypothetical protein
MVKARSGGAFQVAYRHSTSIFPTARFAVTPSAIES